MGGIEGGRGCSGRQVSLFAKLVEIAALYVKLIDWIKRVLLVRNKTRTPLFL